ncbi:MAG: Gfo/Idh/MocA family oxidoreductase [Planctomycetota bacterium]|nr:Gfo/Idh/MocA family oxidoreductase [Planctomycetota bacterium]MDA1161552.1 Gfo/Idh/MocA family oxidoreductase [Planctomycetota bacterium]
MSDKTPSASSRRDFIKSTTVAAAGASAFASLALPTGAFAGNDDVIKVALIGCGGRGTGAATQALSTAGRVKLVVMADAFPDQLENSLKQIKGALGKQAEERVAVAEENKFVGLDAYQKVMASDVDLVILATPPGFRPIHVEAAVAAGKHVFMEKPVATDAPGVRKVLEAVKVAKEKDLKIGVGLQRHHQNTYLETLKRIEDGAIGDVITMRCYWNGGGVWDPRRTRDQVSGEMEYQMRNWYYYTWLCGDHICEQHIHNLDACNWLKGNSHPVECHGMGGRQVRTDKKYGEIFDHFAVEYTYDDGTKMFSQCRHVRNCWNSVSEHAHGSKGTADLGGRIDATGSDSWRFDGKKNNPYQTEHDDLFAAIRNGTPYNEGEYGANSTLTAIMGRMAVYGGKPVKWEDALNSQIDLMPESYTWDTIPKVTPGDDGAYPIAIPGVSKTV